MNHIAASNHRLETCQVFDWLHWELHHIQEGVAGLPADHEGGTGGSAWGV